MSVNAIQEIGSTHMWTHVLLAANHLNVLAFLVNMSLDFANPVSIEMNVLLLSHMDMAHREQVGKDKHLLEHVEVV